MVHLIFNSEHSVDNSSLKLVRHVIDRRKLDDNESLEIIEEDTSMNNDEGPIPYHLFLQFIIKPN